MIISVVVLRVVPLHLLHHYKRSVHLALIQVAQLITLPIVAVFTRWSRLLAVFPASVKCFILLRMRQLAPWQTQFGIFISYSILCRDLTTMILLASISVVFLRFATKIALVIQILNHQAFCKASVLAFWTNFILTSSTREIDVSKIWPLKCWKIRALLLSGSLCLSWSTVCPSISLWYRLRLPLTWLVLMVYATAPNRTSRKTKK